MANLYKTNNRLLGGVLETTPGDAMPSTALKYDVRVNAVEVGLEVNYTDIKGLDGTMTNDLQIPGIVRGNMTFDFNLSRCEVDTGTGSTPTWTFKTPFVKYFKSAGMTATPVNPTDETKSDGYMELAPSSTVCDSITEALFDMSSACVGGTASGIEYKLKGIVNSFTIESSEVGAPIVANFDGQGGVADVKDVVLADLPQFDDVNSSHTGAAVMLNTDIMITEVNIDGSPMTPAAPTLNVCSDVFTLDSGIEKGEITCQQDAFGIKSNVIVSKKPMLSITPMLTSIAESDWWSGMTTQRVYRIVITNYADGTKSADKKAIEIIIPRAQIISGAGEDSNGYRRIAQEFAILKNLYDWDNSTPWVNKADKEKDYTIKVYGKTIDNLVP